MSFPKQQGRARQREVELDGSAGLVGPLATDYVTRYGRWLGLNVPGFGLRASNEIAFVRRGRERPGRGFGTEHNALVSSPSGLQSF